MFWRKCPPEVLEARIIERARKNLRHFGRLGRWWIAFFAVAVTLFVALVIVIGLLVASIVKNPPANRLEFWFGVILGIVIGTGIHRVISGMGNLLSTLLPDDRDRLLIQYHDALRDVLEHRTGTVAVDGNDDHDDTTDGEPKFQAPIDHFG
jgi:hypothetical protein